MSDETLKELPYNKAVILKNITCVYCGKHFGPELSKTEEHVIGRRFVPKSTTENTWNLIVFACKKCNGIKGKLEDDISAISMQPNPAGVFVRDDERLATEALRKGKGSISRLTKKCVKDSKEELKFAKELAPGFTMTSTFIAPPQADTNRVMVLARLQVTALFYWLTFDHNTGKGRYWSGKFYYTPQVLRSDWGNPVMRGFMDLVESWEPRVLTSTANGFFKASIRRCPEAELWSWALEWNENYRIAGFFGDCDAAEKYISMLPNLTSYNILQEPDRTVQIRFEVPLSEDEDRLFFWAPAAM